MGFVEDVFVVCGSHVGNVIRSSDDGRTYEVTNSYASGWCGNATS